MVQQRTAIKIPKNVEGLLEALNSAQRQRFSGRMDALRSQGVSPGDAWQVSATQQRQADLSAYEPTIDEQEAMGRATAQLEGRGVDIESTRFPERTLETATATETDSSGDAGGIDQDESFAQDGRSLVEDEQHEAAPLPMERPGTLSRERRAEGLSGSGEADTGTTDSETTTDDQAASAESILGNARQFLDTAIAAGLVNEDDATGDVRAANQSYVLTRDRGGRLTVENRETGGMVSGDENGVRETHGLTEADQQSWLAYGQVNAEQLQQEQRQEQRRQRQHQSDLEL